MATRLTRTLLLCACSAAVLTYQDAQADQPVEQVAQTTGNPAEPAPAAAAASDQLEEVTVTAEKRAENILDVPTSISVLGGTQLAEQHVEGYDDLTRAVPGVSFSAGGAAGVGVGSESLEIRGISSDVGAATVGIYLDEVPVTLLNQTGTFSPKPFDINRVELLRGPQGTLYGASSEGGTVRFLTNQPNLDEYQVDVSGDVSGTDHGGVNGDGKAIVNVPIIPGILAIRMGAEFTDQSGWIDNYGHIPGVFDVSNGDLLHSEVNGERDQVYRFALTYQPEADFTITPAVTYQREFQADSPAFFLNEGMFNQSEEEPEWARDTDVIGSLTVDKGVGFGTVTSISSFFYRQFNRDRDGTFYDPDVVVPYYLDTDSGNPSPQNDANTQRLANSKEVNDVLAFNPTQSIDRETNHVVTEELRIASPSEKESGLPLTWVGGLFFSNDTDLLNHYEPSPGWDALFTKIYGFGPNNPNLSPIADPAIPDLWQDYFYRDIEKRGVQQIAGFGQVDFDMLPNLHGEVGVRYQWSHLTYSREGSGWWDEGTPHNYSGESDDYALTPKFSVRYDLTPDSNLYATAAKGYRDGGVNSPIPEGLCGPYEKGVGITKEPISYAPDSLWSYEFGEKGLFADHTLSVNADLYYIQWKGVQQQIVIPVCDFDFLSNVGNAEAYGGEIEVQYKVPYVSGLTVGFNGSVEHAVLTSSGSTGAAQTGDKLLYTPDFTADFNASYNYPVSDAYTAYIRVDYDYTGSSHGNFFRDQPDFDNRPYGVANASVGVISDDGLEVQLYAKNLANNNTLIKTPEIAGLVEGYTVQPLTVGLRVEKQFSWPASPSPEVPPPAPPALPAPAPTPAPTPEKQREFQVFFDFDKSNITDAAARVIEAAAEVVKSGGIAHITVTGHTDTVGTAKYNQALSERRASAVKTQLVTDGVSGGEISTVGVGKSGLLVPTADGVREPQNRRAVIELQ